MTLRQPNYPSRLIIELAFDDNKGPLREHNWTLNAPPPFMSHRVISIATSVESPPISGYEN